MGEASQLYVDRLAEHEAAIDGPATATDKMLIACQAAIEDSFQIKNFNPVVEMMLIGADPSVHVDTRIRALSRATAFILPTLKAVEISGNPDKPLQMEAVDAKQRLADLMGLKIIDGVAVPITDDDDEDEDDD